MSPSAEPVSTAYNGLDPKHPFNKLWRGSKDGSVKLEPMPKFVDPYAEREWIKAHLAAVFRYWGKMGYSEGNAGHITVRDPVLPGYYCGLKPNVIGKEEAEYTAKFLQEPEITYSSVSCNSVDMFAI
ncbi:hypothetical protein C0993_001711 [Termitomyces sp. T159_Od127]|nr:hypothetical protein C0993_001711 [Termitomyces sp. T159_Od127]